MDNTYYQKKSSILAGLNIVERFFRGKAMDGMEKIMNLNPMLRMYFDSDLSSPIENKVLQSMYETATFILNNIPKQYNAIWVIIAHHISNVMYSTKLLHHFNTGRIDKDKYIELMSEHIAVEYTAVIKSLWSLIGTGITKLTSLSLRGILTFFQIDPNIQENAIYAIESMMNVAVQYVNSKINKEVAKKILTDCLVLVHDAIKYIAERASNTINSLELFYNNLRDWCKRNYQTIVSLFHNKNTTSKTIVQNNDEKLTSLNVRAQMQLSVK